MFHRAGPTRRREHLGATLLWALQMIGRFPGWLPGAAKGAMARTAEATESLTNLGRLGRGRPDFAGFLGEIYPGVKSLLLDPAFQLPVGRRVDGSRVGLDDGVVHEG
jgi:hypothetical protein